jgi:hypothetical protein
MERPTSISIDLIYDRDGRLDASSLLMNLENALGGRIKVTDWYDENMAADDYPHLNEEERRALISSISTGDYDDAIDRDIRRTVLDEAAASAGLPRWEGDEAEEEDSESSVSP